MFLVCHHTGTTVWLFILIHHELSLRKMCFLCTLLKLYVHTNILFDIIVVNNMGLFVQEL